MTRFNLSFSGECKKVEFVTLGDKPHVKLQLCKKNYGKESAEPTFTWVTVMIREPKQSQEFSTGVFVAGIGSFEARSFIDKTGVKRQSIEVRCLAGDIDISAPRSSDGYQQQPDRFAKKQDINVVHKYTPVADDSDSPPF